MNRTIVDENEDVYLWLDDQRPMPKGYNFHAWSARTAIEKLKEGHVVEIAFDHDLSDDHYGVGTSGDDLKDRHAALLMEETGYTVAKELDRLVREEGLTLPVWSVHTMNPAGRDNIEYLLRRLEYDTGVVREKARIKNEKSRSGIR